MSIKHCADLLYKNDKDRFLASSFIDPTKRENFLCLYAFYIEISKIAWLVKEHELAEIRFMWWHEKITNIFNSNETMEHPVLFSLSKVIKENNLPLEKFSAIIESRKLDLLNKPYRSFNDQIKYFYNSSGSIMELAYRCYTKQKSEVGVKCAQNFGFLQGVSSLISNLPIFLKSGKNVIFYEKNIKKGLQDLVKYSIKLYEENLVYLSMLPKKNFVCFLPAAFSKTILKKAERNPEIFLKKGYKMNTFKKRFYLLKSFYFGKI